MESWSIDPIFGSLTTALCTSLFLLALVLSFGPYRNISKSRRLILLSLRVSIIVILLITMLRPGSIVSETQTHPANIIILTDETQSMLQPSSVAEVSRWEHQSRVWKDTANFLKANRLVVEPKWFGYSDHISTQRWDWELETPEPQKPTGEYTDLGAAIFEAVTSEPGQQVHAVVLMGDGRQTAYRSEVDIRQAINELRRRGVPLIGVPFGREGDVYQSKDVAIEQLPQQFRVFSGNDVTIDAIARLRGVLGSPVQVQLKLTPQNGDPQILQTIEVTATEADDIQPVQFTMTAAQPGVYMLEVEAESADGEIMLANNRQIAYLTVLEGGLRVLYLYGNRLGEQLEMRSVVFNRPCKKLWCDTSTTTSSGRPLNHAMKLSTADFRDRLFVPVFGGQLGSALSREKSMFEKYGSRVRSSSLRSSAKGRARFSGMPPISATAGWQMNTRPVGAKSLLPLKIKHAVCNARVNGEIITSSAC